jgi:hypothetical protein
MAWKIVFLGVTPCSFVILLLKGSKLLRNVGKFIQGYESPSENREFFHSNDREN